MMEEKDANQKMNALTAEEQNKAAFLKNVEKTAFQSLQGLDLESSREIVDYHPLTGGHLWRPALVYFIAQTLHADFSKEVEKNLIHFAAAVELLHNASLLHDDLLDRETLRRGKDCLYRKYGFKNGLLAGNLYYIKAIELSMRTLSYVQSEDLLHTATAMCEGEILQATYEGKALAASVYDRIIRDKTGSLISLVGRQTATLMGEGEENSVLFGRICEELGVIYQLKDDQKDGDVLLNASLDCGGLLNRSVKKVDTLIKALPQRKMADQFRRLATFIINN